MAFSVVLGPGTPAASTVKGLLRFVGDVVSDAGYFGLFGCPVDLPGRDWAHRILRESPTLRGALLRTLSPRSRI